MPFPSPKKQRPPRGGRGFQRRRRVTSTSAVSSSPPSSRPASLQRPSSSLSSSSAPCRSSAFSLRLKCRRAATTGTLAIGDRIRNFAEHPARTERQSRLARSPRVPHSRRTILASLSGRRGSTPSLKCARSRAGIDGSDDGARAARSPCLGQRNGGKNLFCPGPATSHHRRCSVPRAAPQLRGPDGGGRGSRRAQIARASCFTPTPAQGEATPPRAGGQVVTRREAATRRPRGPGPDQGRTRFRRTRARAPPARGPRR